MVTGRCYSPMPRCQIGAKKFFMVSKILKSPRNGGFVITQVFVLRDHKKPPERRFFVIPARFERATHSLEGCCSVQLSYGTLFSGCKYIKKNPFRKRSGQQPYWFRIQLTKPFISSISSSLSGSGSNLNSCSLIATVPASKSIPTESPGR